jgi:TonB-dependent Receptor Plug Domain/CarboxypepD_reg-like domain
MKNSINCIVLLFSILSFAQMQKGKIIDANGIGIEYAYIVNTASQTHAHTDELGYFSIDKTNINEVLIITALGYKKTNYTVTSVDIQIVLEEDRYQLDEVTIQSKMNAMILISKIDLQTAPVNSSQEVLRKVPGLFIGQHAGGGKAEQIFLRGFDIDHGTDLAIAVDGMPVNMVSHAHGQGYADLHFVIPETIEKIDFGKGTYYANKGDFATAGYVAFQTKEKVTKSSISIETGQFNTMRTVGIFNLFENKKNQNAYLATEYVLTDGPFETPQNFKRINLFGKNTSRLNNNSTLSFIVSRFTSKWDASGQIPQRLIDNGLLSRFGAVDATEGGQTSRTNGIVNFSKPINENTVLTSTAYYTHYQFELYSNFTFFLYDPINGDQIRQKESRNLYGSTTEWKYKFNTNKGKGFVQFGFGFRADETKATELSHTLKRSQTLAQLKLGNIDQTNVFSYLNSEFDYGKFKINPAIRLDYFKFNYQDLLATNYMTQNKNKVKVSPKLNFIYTQNNNWQVYLKSGLGFHSNDTRVVVANQGKEIVPTAFGSDLGTIFKPFPRLVVNSALWYLQLQEELVYVGDAATVEISGRTKRLGADLGIRYQLSDYLFLDVDATYTYARSVAAPKGKDYLPLAPDVTATMGLSVSKYKGFSGGFHSRYLNARPANEDNTIVAKGYLISDCNLNYEVKNTTFGIAIENIFNSKWNETQFATESRLQNESNSVEEIHFTPGTPFFFKARIAYRY